MFTTLHFWAGFAAGGLALAAVLAGGLFLLTKVIEADEPDDYS